MSIKTLLEEELKSELVELSKIEVGTQDYERAVKGIAQLVDRITEIDDKYFDNLTKNDELSLKKRELDLKDRELEDRNKDNRIKNILTGLGIAVPTGLTVWGALKSWKFEETGTVTSSIGRMFMNCFKFKK